MDLKVKKIEMQKIIEFSPVLEKKQSFLKAQNRLRTDLINVLNLLTNYDIEKHKLHDFRDNLLEEITKLTYEIAKENHK